MAVASTLEVPDTQATQPGIFAEAVPFAPPDNVVFPDSQDVQSLTAIGEEEVVTKELAATQPDAQVPEASDPDPCEESKTDAATPAPTHGSEVPLAQVPQEEEPVESLVALETHVGDELEEAVVTCRKCGVCHNIATSVMRTDSEWWCKACNAVTTLLRRHMAWPPQAFSSMPLEQQQEFFQQVVQSKEGDSFKYSRVRDILVKNMVRRRITEFQKNVGGTYLPISVYEKKGYIIPPNFKETAPREWSDSLQCDTYLLTEISINEREITQDVE